MKRLISLLVLGLIVAGILAATIWLESERPFDWQQTLQNYLAESAPVAGAAAVRAVAAAQKPWNFPADLTKPVFVDDPLGGVTLPPVRQIQCVWLERRYLTAGKEANRRQEELVLVAYHSDRLWHQGWVVHQLRNNSPVAVETVLATVGCN